MDKSDFNTVRNTAASVKPSRTNARFLMVLFVGLLVNTFVAKAANITSTLTGGNWSNPSTWVGNVVPSPNDNVTVTLNIGSTIVLDVNLTIGSGTYTFNGNVTDNGNHTLTAKTNNGKLIISNNSTITFGGSASWDNSTITVDVGSSLIVGKLTIDNGSTIKIEGSLIVNGNVTDNNNGGGGFSVTGSGYVQVYGNYTAPVGSVSVIGAGVFQTTGTITTSGNSTVGGSQNECTVGPCSSGSLICGSNGTSFTSSVSPTDQVLCSGQTISPISFVTNATGTLTYKWQKSTTNGGTGFQDLDPAQTNSTYTPPQPSQTTWYRMLYSSSTNGCTNMISPSSKISLNNNTPPTTANAGSDQTNCNTSTFTLAGNAPAVGTGTWTVVSGAATITTPNSNTSAVTGITAGTSATLRWTISNGACNTSTDDVILTNNALPATPTGTAAQSFCSINNPTVANLVPTGASINWYPVSTAGTVLATSTALVSGTTYYASQTVSGCESVSRLAVTATVNLTPTITAITATICSAGTFDATPVNSTNGVVPVGTTYTWSSPAVTGITGTAAGTNAANISGTLTNTTNAAINVVYTVTPILGTCTGSTFTVTVTVNPRPTSVVSGTATTCNGTAKTISVALTGTGPWNLTYTDGTTPVSITAIPSSPYTFSVTPTSTKTYTVTALSDSKCTAIPAHMTGSAVITVNSLPVAGLTSNDIDNIFCAGTSVTFTASGGTNYNFRVGGTTVQNGVTATYTTSTLTNGQVVDVIVTNVSNCSTTSSGITNIVNALPTAAPLLTLTPANCAVPTGTITITAVSGETYSFDGSVFSSTLIYSGLAQGSLHTVRSQNASGCISATASSTINTFTPVTKTWDGTSWLSNGVLTDLPTSNDFVIINGNYTITTNFDACSLVINSGKLEVQAGTTLIIQNDLMVNAGATLDVLDKGSLVMVKDSGIVTNTGTTKVHRFTTPFKRYDYVYWSTPVENTSISSTFQSIGWNTNHAYEYIPGSDWSFASTMSPGKGYIIMVPTPTTFDVSEVVFSGKVNNGVKKITGVIPDSSYLLGNPYPSAINADVFLDANAGVLDGTLYFWTHNTAIQLATNITNGSQGSGANAFTSDDYASYNRTGGVGTAPAKSSGSNTGTPTGYIASGQGFFASSNAVIVGVNEIVYNNSMRFAGTKSANNTGVNEQFFRTSSTAKSKTARVLEKHRVWLDLKNSQGAFKQTLVGYISGATNDYDTRFDGESYDGNDFVDFYSINQDKNLTIQGRAVPFDENDTVPLGFKTTIAGSFTININQVDGLLTNQAVYLEDKVTNTVTNLKTGDYTFTTEVGTFDDRFVLRYTDKTLGLNDTDQADGILVFYSNNYKTLIIKNNVMDATVNSVVLFNTTGQRIANFDIKDSGQTNLQIPIKNIASGIYIVKVKTTKGESSKKVIVN